MSPPGRSSSTYNSSRNPSSQFKSIPPPSKPPLKYVPPPVKSTPPSFKSTLPPFKSTPPSFKSIPPPSKSIPPPSQQSNKSEISNKSNNGGFLSSVMDGFSFGIGSSVAREVVGGIFGSSSNNQQTSKVEIPHNKIHPSISTPEYIPIPECKTFQKEYLKCISNIDPESKSNCDFSLNLFSDCEKEWKKN